MNKKYTKIHLNFLRNNLHLPRKELLALFNERFSFFISIHALNSIVYGSRLSSPARGRYTKSQDDFLLRCRLPTVKEICSEFNKEFGLNRAASSIGDRLHHLLGERDGGAVSRRIMIGGKNILLKQFVWECVNGPLPGDHAIIFVDGNSGNYRIENLKAIPRSAVNSASTKVGRNVPIGGSREFKAAIIAVSALQHQIQQYE
ncbi:MAG: HNH endonuclease [Pseudomonadota bacterium]